MKNKIIRTDFGTIYNGQKTHLYKVSRSNISFTVTDFGCCITSLNVKNKDGSFTDVVLGFETLDSYATTWGSFGAIVGRYSNRIGGAAFSVNGETYRLTENTEGACLHGGFPAWGNVMWKAKKIVKSDASGILFSRDFKDGEQGFPGNLHVEVEYLISDDCSIKMTYRATTDKETPLSITNHSYFNLRGKDLTKDYILKLNCKKYVQQEGEKGLPNGVLADVKDTVFDFTEERTIVDGKTVPEDFKGYDLCYVTEAFNKDKGIPLSGDEPVLAAELTDPVSGRKMEMFTNQEGVQLYTSRYVKFVPGKDGYIYMPYQAVCLESQSFPDSPNQKSFPDVMLKPEQQYEGITVYRFS